MDFHHDTHTHPFIAPTDGVSSGSFVIPTDGETSANTWFRIYLTATDSDGNRTTTSRDVFPQKSTINVAANFAGLTVHVNAQPRRRRTRLNRS